LYLKALLACDCAVRAGVFAGTAVKAFTFIYNCNIIVTERNCSCWAFVYATSTACTGIGINFCYHVFHSYLALRDFYIFEKILDCLNRIEELNKNLSLLFRETKKKRDKG
jgi:hypothetical protein